ncbi:MAG: response regulator, partial [Pseudomonadales bacterium]|nr:response regulator [Pseudomonadales bacterium]
KTQREYQTVASSASESLLDLIDDILDFSKISSGAIYLESHFFNVRHTIRDCVEMLGPVAHEKGLELSYVCEPHIPLRVKGDSKRLKQIIVNLVSNAIKYSDEGEVIIEVYMTFPQPGQGILRVHVRDDGPGLSLPDQEQIFQAFNRLQKDGSINGTGLGLAVCHGLVASMGGEIGVFSKEKNGSTFWFAVPIKISTQQKEGLQAHACMENKRILLLGATKGMSHFFQVEVKEWGMSLDEMEEVDELDSIESSSYDLIILNMQLGSAQSLVLSKNLVNSSGYGNTPQIILTSLAQRGMVETVEHGRKYPEISFLTKPVFKKSLYESILTAWNIEREKSASITKFPEKESGDSGYFILLVEDNNINQMVAKGMIKKLGHDVTVVSNGSEALGMLEERHFDLVLMDCIMPVMDGYMAASEIRKREHGSDRHISVIAMTANTFEGEEQRCLAAGMDDYLAKPVSAAALDVKLRRWLGKEVTRAAVINTHEKSSPQADDLKKIKTNK